METTGPKSPSAAKRLPGLDYLRFTAAMLVVAYHYLFRGGLGGQYLDFSWSWAAPVLQYAYFGVQLFFVISGFVILWSAEHKDWFSFGAARIIRLWPGYALAVSLTAVATLVYAQPTFETGLWHWAANLTFFAPALGQPFMDGVYWTIVLELVFYFWIVLGLLSGVLPKHILAFCCAWLAIIVFNEFWLNHEALRLGLVTRYGAWFVIGIALYHLWSRGPSLLAGLVLAGAVWLSMIMAAVEQRGLAGVYGYEENAVAPIIANCLIVLLVAFMVSAGGAIRATGLASMLGALTYPLYLLHQHIGYMLINAMSPSMGRWTAVACTSIVVIALSYAVHVGWERPISAQLRKVIAELRKHMPGALGVKHRVAH